MVDYSGEICTTHLSACCPGGSVLFWAPSPHFQCVCVIDTSAARWWPIFSSILKCQPCFYRRDTLMVTWPRRPIVCIRNHISVWKKQCEPIGVVPFVCRSYIAVIWLCIDEDTILSSINVDADVYTRLLISTEERNTRWLTANICIKMWTKKQRAALCNNCIT